MLIKNPKWFLWEKNPHKHNFIYRKIDCVLEKYHEAVKHILLLSEQSGTKTGL